MKKLIVPAVVILMAVTSAFSTGDTSNEKLAIMPGFIQHNEEGTNCERKDDCSTIVSGTLCRVGQVSTATPLWIKDINGECLVKGYKP